MEWTGYIMAKDTIVAAVDDGWVSVCDQHHCPYYWFKPFNLALSYADIRCTDNPADRIALNGGWDIDQPLSLHTPELTNIDSFEK